MIGITHSAVILLPQQFEFALDVLELVLDTVLRIFGAHHRLA
jgi:hypothetical protein